MSEVELLTDAHGLVWEFHEGQDDHLALGGHEPGLIEMCRALLPERGCFLDVGAHVGLYSLNLASKARDVYAIEANPLTYEVLKRNIQRNADTYDAVIHALNLAAWDCPAELTLIDEQDKETGGSTRCVEEPGDRTTQALPLDGVLPDRCSPDLVKIDVEGGEAHVLRGLHRTIVTHLPILFIEMHDMYWGEEIRTEVIEFLNLIDYDWRDDITFSTSYYILARPKTAKVIDFPGEIVKAGSTE